MNTTKFRKSITKEIIRIVVLGRTIRITKRIQSINSSSHSHNINRIIYHQQLIKLLYGAITITLLPFFISQTSYTKNKLPPYKALPRLRTISIKQTKKQFNYKRTSSQLALPLVSLSLRIYKQIHCFNMKNQYLIVREVQRLLRNLKVRILRKNQKESFISLKHNNSNNLSLN